MEINSLSWNVIYSLTAGIVGSVLTLIVESRVNKQKIDNLKQELDRVTNAVNGGIIPELIADVKTKIKDLDNDTQEQKKNLSDIKGAIKFINNDLKIINDDYQELCSFLEYFLENQDTIERTKKLLEVVSNNSQQSDTIVQLHKRISQVENKQKSQEIIKIGTFKTDTPELNEDGKSRRTNKRPVKFNHTFSNIPEVYVALMMVDAEADSSKTTRVQVFVDHHSVQRDRFTLITETWERSKVFNVEVVWIAIGN